jgi:hypothetical protein
VERCSVLQQNHVHRRVLHDTMVAGKEDRVDPSVAAVAAAGRVIDSKPPRGSQHSQPTITRWKWRIFDGCSGTQW